MTMKTVFPAVALAAVLACSSAALGAGSPVLNDDPKVNCKKADTTYDINVCAGRDYKKTYGALVKLYGQLYAKYDADNKKMLQASQVGWEKYVGAECSYETYPGHDGSLNSTNVTNCQNTLAAERIKQLQAQANCEEGDMSCNHP
jgi:uncharacterized protein YecT (DUF1311 family)